MIALSRIDELRDCSPPSLGFRKLIRLCEEMNACHTQGCHFAVAMIARAIVDHVPPAFGFKKFTEVVANYGGGKSFSDAMRHLDEASRKIADAVLHIPMRPAEALPTAQQVNCGQQLDTLVAGIIRITPRAAKTI